MSHAGQDVTGQDTGGPGGHWSLPRTHAAVLLAVVAVGVPVLWQLAQASALLVPLQHVDGAYQTLAMLRHLDRGELPGRDFHSYLGMGIPYVLLPLYWLGGSTLAASQAAATFVGLLATFAGGSLLCALALAAAGMRKPTVLALGLGLLLLVLALPEGINAHNLVLPGTSLYALRSALAYVVAAGVWYSMQAHRWRPLRSGAITAVALTWSNDYAFTSVLFLHLMLAMHVATIDSARAAARGAAVSLTIGMAGYALLGSLLTAGHLAEVLRFNLGAVAADQHWYFGPYARSEHFLTLSDIPRFWYRPDIDLSNTLLFYAGFGALLLMPRARRNLGEMAVGSACATAFLAGLGSEFGGHKSVNYHQMTAHLLPLLAFVTIVPGWHRDGTRAPTSAGGSPSIVTSRLVPFLELSVVLLLGACAVLTTLTARQHVHAVAHNPSLHYEPALGGYVSMAMAREFSEVRRTFGPQPAGVVSTYLNPYDLLLPHTSHAPTDSIIHALGWLRPRFIQALADPRVTRAITTNPRSPYSADATWANWGLHENWLFHRELLRTFEPAYTGTRLVVWRRRSSASTLRFVPVECANRVSPRRNEITVPGQRVGDVHDIALRYTVKCDGAFVQQRALVVVRAASRHGHFGGAFSLSPDGQAHAPHVPLRPNDALTVYASPPERCTLQVIACQAYRLEGISAAARAALDLPTAPR